MSFACPDCKKVNLNKSDICPNCNRKFTADEIAKFTKKYNRDVRHGCLLIIAVIAIVGFSMKHFFFSGDSPTANITVLAQEIDIKEENTSEDLQKKAEAEKIEAEKREAEKIEAEKKRNTRIEHARQQNIVVVTPSGSKYHKRDCRTVRRQYREVSVKQAINSGYEQCKVCSPPLREWIEEDFDFPVYK